MYKDIFIKLNPYLGRSKNLMEFFVIIGYEERILTEYAKNNILDKVKDNLELSIISSVISDLAYGAFDDDKVIKQIYPDKPKIIKIMKNEQKPKPNSVIFYSCFDSLVGNNKVLYSCYALRFYERFTFQKSSYYIPKSFLIFSQYPYFTTYHNICTNVLEIVNEDKYNRNSIPIEILLYCLVNYIRSPINSNLKLKLFPNKNEIIIPKLSGYPYTDFDLCKIFNYIPINEFIKIYLLTFLEIGLLLFSPDLLKLNIFMYILNMLNYPLIDSNYFWHIKSISKYEIKLGEDVLNPTFRGVNSSFSPQFDFKNYKNINFIVDLENKAIKCIDKEEKEETVEIMLLLKYFQQIINGKKVQSLFLSKCLFSLNSKLIKIKKEYDKKVKSVDSFFNVNKIIIEVNKLIQEAFYDFTLNILIIFYKDYQLNPKCDQIDKKEFSSKDISKEEAIFLNYYRKAIKYNTYFDLFVRHFEAVDELKVSLVFSDEYVNVKMMDSKDEIPDKINYFKLMDRYYGNSKNYNEINSELLKEEFNKTYKERSIRSYTRESENQLFDLDKKIIKVFLFHKKSRDLFYSLKIKEKEEIKFDLIEKVSIASTLETFFYRIINREYLIRSSSVYIFAIVFPFFPHEIRNAYLKEIIKNVNKMKFFQRYYIYIILKSIYKYYLINQKKNQFTEFYFENIQEYCTCIKDFLIKNSIIPNEEIFTFLKKVLSDGNLNINNNDIEKDNKDEKDKKDKKDIKDGKDNEDDKDNDDKKDNKDNKNEKDEDKEDKKGKKDNNFIFKYDKDKYFDKNIADNIVQIDNNHKEQLVLVYKGKIKKYKKYNDTPEIHQLIYASYDTYFFQDFNVLNLDCENFYDKIVNLIYFLMNNKCKKLAMYLLNSMTLLKQLQNDIKEYKSDNFNSHRNIINNINNNNNNNENLIIEKIDNENNNDNINNIQNINNNAYRNSSIKVDLYKNGNNINDNDDKDDSD